MVHEAEGPLTSPDPPAAELRRIERGAEACARVAIAALPLLRPLLWSGEPTDLPNLLFLALLAGAAACGLLWRGVTGHLPRRSWPGALGVAFLAVAAVGCWRSPYPADAAALWSGWALHLGAAWALAPLIARHRRWALAGLCAGLACECLLLVAQVAWERPDLQRSFADDPALIDPALRAQWLDRVVTWRLEGTFLLANTLADYLLIALPFVVGLAARCWRARAPDRWWLTALAAAALVALARTGSKAGILAGLVVAASVALAVRPRAGLAVAALAALALAASLAVPGVRARAVASLGVRLDYWRGAAALVRERPWTGWGLDGFRCEWPRVKPAGAEDTIVVHDEPLQAAADLGLPAAALLLAWWTAALLRLRPRRIDQPPDAVEPPTRTWPTVVAAIAVAAYLVVAVGALADRAASWPHGGAWLLLVPAALAAAILARAPRLPTPPAWCAFAAVAGPLVHALADFHLHSPQVVGVLAFAAFLPTAVSPPPAAPRPRLGALVAVALLLACVGGIGWSAWRGQARERAELADRALVRLLVAQRGNDDDAATQRAVSAVVDALAAYRLPPTTDPGDLAALAIDQALASALLPPEDPAAALTAAAIAVHAARLDPERAGRSTAALERLAARWPRHLVFVDALARHRTLLAARDPAWRLPALAAWRAVVALHPTRPAYRLALADAAEAAGDAATAAAERERARALPPDPH